VDRVNAARLDSLPGPAVTFAADDSGAEAFLSVLQAGCPARASVALKVGAQVVLLKSLAPALGLVNGARGVVTGFAPAIHARDPRYPVVRFAAGPTRVVERRHGPSASG
jgi:ATP-dependent DNA helicase PIF1